MTKKLKFSALISFLLGIAVLLLTFVIGYYAKEEWDNNQVFRRSDQPTTELVGPRQRFSSRSKKEVNVFLNNSPEVLGAIAIKREFSKKENPVFDYWSRSPIIDKFVNDWNKKQAGPNGISSADLAANPQNSFNNALEAVLGEARCVPVIGTTFFALTPEVVDYAKTICLVSFPPYQLPNKSITALGFLLALDHRDPKMKDLKDKMVTLQINIFNRDYNGRETWDHP